MVERAKKYAELHSRGWSGENKKAVYDKAYKEYIKIAEEQKKADIDKACEIVRDLANEYFGDWEQSCKFDDKFRKAMEI